MSIPDPGARERPRTFADLWHAPSSPTPPTTISNPLGVRRPEHRTLERVSIGPRFRRLSAEDVARLPAVERSGGIDLSPDGSEVAFAWDVGGTLEIYATALRGPKIIQLTDARRSSRAPRWSPDGRSVAFVRDDAGGTTLWVVDRDGDRERKVADAAAPVRDHAWSPDGRHIALAEGDGRSAITVIDVATGAARRVGPGARPAWSPDGAWLLFSRADGDSGDLFIVGARGGDPRALDTRDGARGMADDGAWSPDGATIAFTRVAGARREVAFASLRDGALARVEPLGPTPFDADGPVWRPDSRGVVYRRHRGGDVSLRRAFTVSHADDAVMDLPGTHRSARVALDSETVVALLGDARGVEVVLRPKGAVTIAKLTSSLPAGLDPAVFVDPVHATDGPAAALVYVPHAEAADGSARTVVALVTGDPRRDRDPLAQLLANHGHPVVVGPAGAVAARRILAGTGLGGDAPILEMRPLDVYADRTVLEARLAAALSDARAAR